jgi:hypothetical protein
MREGAGNRLFKRSFGHHRRGRGLFKPPKNLAGWSETGHPPRPRNPSVVSTRRAVSARRSRPIRSPDLGRSRGRRVPTCGVGVAPASRAVRCRRSSTSANQGRAGLATSFASRTGSAQRSCEPEQTRAGVNWGSRPLCRGPGSHPSLRGGRGWSRVDLLRFGPWLEPRKPAEPAGEVPVSLTE